MTLSQCCACGRLMHAAELRIERNGREINLRCVSAEDCAARQRTARRKRSKSEAVAAQRG